MHSRQFFITIYKAVLASEHILIIHIRASSVHIFNKNKTFRKTINGFVSYNIFSLSFLNYFKNHLLRHFDLYPLFD